MRPSGPPGNAVTRATWPSPTTRISGPRKAAQTKGRLRDDYAGHGRRDQAIVRLRASLAAHDCPASGRQSGHGQCHCPGQAARTRPCSKPRPGLRCPGRPVDPLPGLRRAGHDALCLVPPPLDARALAERHAQPSRCPTPGPSSPVHLSDRPEPHATPFGPPMMPGAGCHPASLFTRRRPSGPRPGQCTARPWSGGSGPPRRSCRDAASRSPRASARPLHSRSCSRWPWRPARR